MEACTSGFVILTINASLVLVASVLTACASAPAAATPERAVASPRAARATPTPSAAPVIREVTSESCIRVLDLAEESFTYLAEAGRGMQAQVDALLVGDANAYQSGRARYAQAHAKVPPADAASADTAACRALAVPVAGPAISEVTPPSCIRSLEYFARAFQYLSESIRAIQSQVDALLVRDTNGYLRGKEGYAQAFAKIREVDAPLRADHTDCRSKAMP